jgi:hypothetical protein
MDSCQLYFFQSGQEGKAIIRISVVLKEGTRDAVIICAFCPERLEPWEVLEELAPWPRQSWQT